MGSARAGSPKATSRRAKRRHSRSTSRRRSSKAARSHSSRRGSKRRNMRTGRKGKSSRGGKGRALIKRSSTGRSSLGSHRIRGKTVSAKMTRGRPKRAICAFFYFIKNEREMAKKQRMTLPPLTEWTQAVAMKWRRMKKHEKRPFQQKAQGDKLRYEQQMAKFKR